MLALVRSTRAWVYVLSVAALLVPAGGIAYLGAVSYRDERGAVDAQIDRERAAALAIAARIDRAIEDALDATDRATTVGASEVAAPLARYWFWIDADGQGTMKLRVPRAAAPELDLGGGADRGASCSGPALEDCVRELATRQSRLQRLRAALRAEATGTPAGLAEARRQDTALAAFADTGPTALLGLARVLTRLGDGKGAQAALAEADQRFGDRSFEGVPVRLATAELRAQAGGTAGLLALARAVLDDKFAVAPVVQLGVLARLRAQLAGELTAGEAQERAELDERVARIRREARTAAGLADDVAELVRSATPAWRGRSATHQPGRTLIYRRRADNGIVGFAIDAPMIEEAAGHDATDDVALHVRPRVLAAGATPGPELRTVVQVPLGAELPHLSLALVNPVVDPNPHDEVIRERSRRHVVFTSALAIALGLGILATIRGAARARELAQLKSDFVSTVSHELKTPLTSIRMFAEMLEQGVAKGDPSKMARYHGVIVQESQRLGLLIANLLDYAQIERGTRRYAQSRQELGELVRHAVTTFETLRDPEKGSNPIEVEVSPEAMIAEVEVDREVVVQAVLNLLANAAKYGGAERPIEVAVGADGTTGWLSVRDHGPGIPAAEQARIFREFYRAPEAYRSGVEGTGLGLALVKQHVEALGGTVEVASTVGEGATFTIRLPLTAAKAA